MLLYMCAVRDSATEAFAQPIFVPRPAVALRSFGEECNRKPTEGNPNALYTHPSDYELYQLGVYDDNTGDFSPAKERLARAVDFHMGRDAD